MDVLINDICLTFFLIFLGLTYFSRPNFPSKTMPKTIFRLIAFTVILGSTTAISNDNFAKKILSSQPQADRDGDGVLSASEEAAVVQGEARAGGHRQRIGRREGEGEREEEGLSPPSKYNCGGTDS